MSPSDSSSQPGHARLAGLVRTGAVLCGVLLALAAATLIYIGQKPDFLAVHLFGVPVSPRRLAAGLGVLAAAVIVAVDLAAAFRRTGVVAGPVVRGTAGLAANCYTGDIHLKLSEPGPGEGKIMLLDAVQRAYGESQGTAAAAFASFAGTSDTDIAEMYATFFAEHVPVYGRKRPSSDIIRITMSGSDKDFAFEDGLLILKARHADERYDGLHIKAADYPLVLARLRDAS